MHFLGEGGVIPLVTSKVVVKTTEAPVKTTEEPVKTTEAPVNSTVIPTTAARKFLGQKMKTITNFIPKIVAAKEKTTVAEVTLSEGLVQGRF